MTRAVFRLLGLAACVVAGFVGVRAQTPAGSVGPRPNVGPADRPLVNPAAVQRGARVWSAECVTCHGASARGTSQAPSLVHSLLVLRDRQGSQLGPFLKKGHPTQSGRPSASLADADVVDLTQFLRQRINDTLRGSTLFVPGNVVTGDAAAGSAYFTGEGACTQCHSATGDLRGLATRYSNPVDLQQRVLFPVASRFTGGSGGGAATVNRTAITVTLTPTTGAPISGVLVSDDDFFVSYRDEAGIVRTVRRTSGLKVVITNPLRAHHEWLDRVTDKNIHDLVAYLVTLK